MDQNEDHRAEEGAPTLEKTDEQSFSMKGADTKHDNYHDAQKTEPSRISQHNQESDSDSRHNSAEAEQHYSEVHTEETRYNPRERESRHPISAYRLSGVKTSNQLSNNNPYSRFQEEDIMTFPQGERNIDSMATSVNMSPSRSSTVRQGLSIQDAVAAKVNVLSNDIHSDLDITASSSHSSLSQSSSKTLIGKPKPTLYMNKSTPYSSVISGLSTPAKISHSNTHHYLPATEGLDRVIIDVKHEIVDPDFDTSLQEKRRPVNKRGVCNLMTIIIILGMILFMFAGYPLSLYISKRVHPTTTDSATGYSSK